MKENSEIIQLMETGQTQLKHRGIVGAPRVQVSRDIKTVNLKTKQNKTLRRLMNTSQSYSL